MISKLSYASAFLSLLLIGCANKTDGDVDVQASRPTDLESRYAESSGFKTDADGNLISSKSDKRSSFERQRETPYFKGSIEKKEYKTGDYEKKSWWGKKTYDVGEYEGDTDGSRFKTPAKSYGKGELYADKRVDKGDPYKTQTLEYQRAVESNEDDIKKPRNDYAESRRRSYVQPSVIDWKEQRKMSMEQSRSILGR